MPTSRRPARRSARQSDEGMTVDALATHSGVSVRNIRAYQTAGLLPPPRLDGRTAVYDEAHLGKLVLIRDLRKQGFRLEAIKQMLGNTPDGAWPEYALISQLFSTTFFAVEQPQRKAISEMASHWAQPATQAQKDRLSHNGLYRPLGPDEVEMLSPSLERIGIQLAELDVPLDTVLDMQDTLIQHLRTIAKAYVEEIFMGMARVIAEQAARKGQAGAGLAGGIDPAVIGPLKLLFERLRPLAMGSVGAAFPVILQQEFDRCVASELQRKVSAA